MKRCRLVLASILGLAACGGDDGGESGDTTGTSTGTSTTSTSTETSSEASGASMSTTGAPNCDAEPTTCTQCWECAQIGVCKEQYESCAASIDCAGSLACIDYMCPADGLEQSCIDHCCQNCAEHFACSFVDAIISCVEMQCAELCGPVTCAG